MAETVRDFEQEDRRQELVDFYKQWLSDALTTGLAGVDSLVAIRNRLKLDRHEVDQLHFHGIDTELTKAALEQLETAIETEVTGAAADISQHVFEDNMFEAFIVAGDEVLRIDGVVAGKENLLPLVDSQIYDGRIDRLVFAAPGSNR